MGLIRNIIKEHLDPHPKVGDYLYANTDMFTHIKELKKVITMGNIYPILGVSVSHNEITILNNSKNVFTLPVPTVEINFTVVPKEELLNVDDAFDKLYESVKGIPHDLKLIFDPPISNSHDFKNVMRVFHLKYPNLKWRGGEDCLDYNPIEKGDIEEGEDAVSYIQIKYGKLAYISTSDSEFEDSKKSKNGWKWIEKNDTDFDMTSRLFDSLNESEEAEVENYDFLRDINLVGMEFRYDGEIYSILKNVDEDGYLLLTNPYYGKQNSGFNQEEFLKYELGILIDALNRGDHAELVLDDINLDNLYDNLNESNELKYPIDKGTTLYCHRGMNPLYTAGKYYTVTAIHYQTEHYPYDTINIKDNFGQGGSFTIQKDGQDLNYETWFTLGDSTFDTTKAFDSLYESEDEIKFSVGDRVIVNEGNIILNEIGTIVYIDTDEPNIIYYVVEFDTWNEGHSAGGFEVCKKLGHCWWVEAKGMELAPDTYSMMDKLYEAKKLVKTKYSYLADSNLIGLKFRLGDKTYTIVENVNEYGYLIITYPSFYKGKIKTSSYKLTDLIDRLNSGFLTLVPSDIKESENKVDYSELRHSEDLTGLKLRDKNGTIYTITNQVGSQLSMTVDFTHSQPNIPPGKMTLWLKSLVEYLDHGILEIIELPGGADINLDKLYESEEDNLEWARDIVSNTFISIEVGDVFYIVDSNAGKNVLPWSHRPNNVRFIITIVETGPDWVKKIVCNPNNVTYNKSDYSPNNDRYINNDISKVDLDWALELIGMAYWRRM